MQGRLSSITKQSVAGSLLLAHPTLREDNFRHTVILMSSHDDEGAMGVVLNRPLGRRLGELNGEFALGPLAQLPVFRGGPVVEHFGAQLILAAWEIRLDGFRLHFGIDPQKAVHCLEEGMHVRAFLGYSGWSGGQLESELMRHTWVVSAIPEDLVDREQDEGLWRNLLGAMGDQWRLLADEPDDPELN